MMPHTRPHSRRWMVLVLLCTTLAACGEQGGSQGPPGAMEARRFDEAYALVDSLTPEQGDTNPLIRVSGMAFDTRGRLAIADASEGNVKLYDRTGHLLRVIGRKGEGPGEFSQPRFPRFTPDGALYVGDGQLGRVTRFDAEGGVVRVMPYVLIPMMGFDLAGSEVILSGAGDDGRVALFSDTLGTRERWVLEAVRLRAGREPDNPIWKFVTQYWVAVGGDTAYVASTVSDSIWSIPLGADTAIARQLVVPGYVAPTLPAEMPRGVKALMEWQKSFHIAAKIIATDRLVAIPFVQGVLNYGDPMILAVRRDGKRWLALTGGPPIVHAVGDTLVGLLHPDVEPTTLGLFAPTAVR